MNETNDAEFKTEDINDMIRNEPSAYSPSNVTQHEQDNLLCLEPMYESEEEYDAKQQDFSFLKPCVGQDQRPYDVEFELEDRRYISGLDSSDREPFVDKSPMEVHLN